MQRQTVLSSFRFHLQRLGTLVVVAAIGFGAFTSSARADFIFLPLNASQVSSYDSGELWSYAGAPFTSGPVTSFSRSHFFSNSAPAGNTLSIRDFDSVGFGVDSSTTTYWVADYVFTLTDFDGTHVFSGTVASDSQGDFQGDFSVAEIPLQYVRRVDIALSLSTGSFRPSNFEVRLFGSAVNVVPEPATLGFLAVAAAAAVLRTRRADRRLTLPHSSD